MQKTAAFIFSLLLATIAGCSTTYSPKSAYEAPNNAVLIVTAKNMNANVSSKELNKLMESEVLAFSKSLKETLQDDGKEVNLRAFEYASQNDIALEIARMPKKPSLLVQAYWTVKQDKSLYIVADSLNIRYQDSEKNVDFTPLNKREYLSIGLSAKPSDTPENHAKDYSLQLNTTQHESWK